MAGRSSSADVVAGRKTGGARAVISEPTMTWKRVFLVVTGCALAGMVMGGAFGFASGKITPEFFRRIIPWQEVEPVGVATFFGATTGVLLGGGLGCFGIVVQGILEWRKRGRETDANVEPRRS